ncbi:MAG: hypothetical protein AAGI34_08335 [Pseudomonadota bacterium]
MSPVVRVLLGAGLLAVLTLILVRPPTSQAALTHRADNAEDVRRGLHCLSGWDGAHRDVVAEVRPTLWNPASFEHLETRVISELASAKHRLFMKYRARDERGDWQVGYAEAAFDGRTCASWGVRVLD